MKIGIDIGKQRLYNKNFKLDNVIKWEVLNIEDDQKIKITFIDKKSKYRQGIWIATDEGIEIGGQVYKQIYLWQDTAPKEVYIKCYTKVGLLSIYNIWDDGECGVESQLDTTGMKVIKNENNYIYYCNNYGIDNKFNDLVFSIDLM